MDNFNKNIIDTIKYNKSVRDIKTYTNKEESFLTKSVFVNTDGRDLSFIDSNSIDAIITDHPWHDPKAHHGTNQKNLVYEYQNKAFNYNEKDIKEKYRVLKNGSYCVEFLPQLSITNIGWMLDTLNLFIKNGFEFQGAVDWIKGKIWKVKIDNLDSIEFMDKSLDKGNIINKNIDLYKGYSEYFDGEGYIVDENVYEIIQSFKQNQGKKIKDGEQLFFFTKGNARKLKIDYTKIKKLISNFAGEKYYKELYNEVFEEDKINILYVDFANELINKEWKNKNNTDIKNLKYKEFKKNFICESKSNTVKEKYCQSGTKYILPSRFIVPQVNEKIHDSEKPIELYKEIIMLITKPGEIILDQFAGSGNLGKASNILRRNSILIEEDEKIFKKSNLNFNIIKR